MTGGDATTAETGRTPSPGFLTLPSPPHPRVHWCFTLRSGGVSPMVRLMPIGLSVRARTQARSSRKACGVRALSDGMQPRMPASAQASSISRLEMMNIGAATSGYRRPSLTCKGVGLMGSQL